jgi:GNAT superfamily N-acetyltransferase
MPSNSPRFRSRIAVAFSELSFSPFSKVAELEWFHCGSGDLDEFLKTDQVQKYAAQGYGQTTLVWREHELSGYYTLGYGEISAEQLKKGVKASPLPGYFIEENVPAAKIGRLAVDRRHQGKGIGRVMVAKILNDVMEGPSVPPVMVVRANPGSIDFWLKCGFSPVVGSQRGRTSSSMTLFFVIGTLHEPDIRAMVNV